MNADYQASIDFLLKFCPDGPWLPTAIWPDAEKPKPHEDRSDGRDGLIAKTFHKGEEQKMRDWIERFNRMGRGIYFHVNPRIGDINSKAKKSNIESLSWIHVDVDPEPKQDIDDERARILKLFTDNRPAGVPEPTILLFSGGGYQAFWRLGSPMVTQGQERATAEAERYNKQMEILFDGDNCFNIDRVMRLPGTINWPKQAKIDEKGQQAELAKVLSWASDTVYDLGDFTAATIVQDANDFQATRAQTVNVSGNVKSLSPDDIQKLPISDWHKVIIVQGLNPDKPLDGDDQSPSAWQWALSCELARQDVDDDTHYAILMDRDLGISASIYKKGSGADRYAKRQIARAKESAIEPELCYMNDNYAAVKLWDGSFWIIHEEWDELEQRHILVRMNKNSLFDSYANRFVDELVMGPNGPAGTKAVPLGAWWFKHKQRRTYSNVKFAPGIELAPDVYNLWRGFSCEARPGDCSLYLEHVLNNVCNGKAEHFEFLMNWMARLVQKPSEPGTTAVILRGPQGTGKGVFINMLGDLFGRHFQPVSDPKRVTGAFNAHLRDCVLLFADEAFHTASRSASSGALKALITEERVAYEVKGKEVAQGRNFIHLVMASNEDWIVPADIDDRRFFVLDVSADRQKDFGYFGAIKKQMATGGLEALLHTLLTRDISKFNHREAPQTTALRDQKEETFDAATVWWKEKLESGNPTAEKGWDQKIYTSELAYDFRINTETDRPKRSITTQIGKMLRDYLPDGSVYSHRESSSMNIRDVDGMEKMMRLPRYYRFPSLADCRAHFDKKTKSSWDWPEIIITADDSVDDTNNDGNGEF